METSRQKTQPRSSSALHILVNHPHLSLIYLTRLKREQVHLKNDAGELGIEVEHVPVRHSSQHVLHSLRQLPAMTFGEEQHGTANKNDDEREHVQREEENGEEGREEGVPEVIFLVSDRPQEISKGVVVVLPPPTSRVRAGEASGLRYSSKVAMKLLSSWRFQGLEKTFQIKCQEKEKQFGGGGGHCGCKIL